MQEKKIVENCFTSQSLALGDREPGQDIKKEIVCKNALFIASSPVDQIHSTASVMIDNHIFTTVRCIESWHAVCL